MSVQKDVQSEQKDHRNNQLRNRLQDHIALAVVLRRIGDTRPLRRIAVVRDALLMMAALVLLALAVQQKNDYRAGTDEEYVGLAERIERTVLQDHSGDRVHNAGFLAALLEVALRDLVVGGRVRASERRHISDIQNQHADDHQAHDHSNDIVKTADSPESRHAHQSPVRLRIGVGELKEACIGRTVRLGLLLHSSAPFLGAVLVARRLIALHKRDKPGRFGVLVVFSQTTHNGSPPVL